MNTAMRIFVFLTLVGFATAYASTPPKLPSVLPPQMAIPLAVAEAPIERVTGRLPMSREEVWQLHLGGTISNALISSLQAHGKIPPLPPPAIGHARGTSVKGYARLNEASVEPALVSSLARRVRFTPQVKTLSAQTTNATKGDNMPKEVAEPTNIVQRLNGVDHTIIAYLHYPQSTDKSEPVVTIATKTPGDAAWTIKSLPMPPSMGEVTFSGPPYSGPGDPVLVQNPYSSGENPNTVFCAATVFAYETSGGIGENAIVVWSSTDGGNTWHLFGIPLRKYSGDIKMFDKPAAAVSMNPSSLGRLYVSALSQPKQFSPSDTSFIYTVTPTPGANPMDPGNWTLFGAISFSHNVLQSPQIMVDAVSGDIYLAYLNWTYHTINIVRNSSGCWCTPTYSFASGQNVPGTQEGKLIWDTREIGANDILDNNSYKIQAGSVLIADFNAVDGSVGVVYHRRKGSFGSEVVFNRFFQPATGAGSWQSTYGTVVNQSIDHYTWNGALDYDESGNYLIVYYDYDHGLNPYNIQYQLWATRWSAAGVRLDESRITNGTGPDSDAHFVYHPGAGPYILGEYQGLWYWYGTWHTASVYVRPNGANPFTDPGFGDIWESQILP